MGNKKEQFQSTDENHSTGKRGHQCAMTDRVLCVSSNEKVEDPKERYALNLHCHSPLSLGNISNINVQANKQCEGSARVTRRLWIQIPRPPMSDSRAQAFLKLLFCPTDRSVNSCSLNKAANISRFNYHHVKGLLSER